MTKTDAGKSNVEARFEEIDRDAQLIGSLAKGAAVVATTLIMTARACDKKPTGLEELKAPSATHAPKKR